MKIELKDDDTVLIMDKDGECKIYIPDLNDEDNVPNNVFFMSSILLLINTDEEFNDFVIDRFNKKLDELDNLNPFEVEDTEDAEEEVYDG
jgi:hypothetical protein